MKTKTIILTLMLCCIAISTKAQKPGYVHKTLAQCGGDTLKYLQTMAYSGAFAGRPVNEFMNKLGLPVKGVKYHLNVNNKATLTTIELILTDISTYQYKLQKKIPRLRLELLVHPKIGQTVSASTVKYKFGGVAEGAIVPYTGALKTWIETQFLLHYVFGGVGVNMMPPLPEEPEAVMLE